MEKLSINELASFLITKGVSEAASKILQNEEVDGMALLKLTESSLRCLEIKMGQIQKLLALIEEDKRNAPKKAEQDCVGLSDTRDFGDIWFLNEDSIEQDECSSLINCRKELDDTEPVRKVPKALNSNILQPPSDLPQPVQMISDRGCSSTWSSTNQSSSSPTSPLVTGCPKVNSASTPASSPSEKPSTSGYSAPFQTFGSKGFQGGFSDYSTVREVLTHHAQGKALLGRLENTKEEFKDIHTLVRIVTNSLKDFHGSYYPPDEAKLNLAKAIVAEFPRLSCNDGENEMEGHECFYHNGPPKGGFIQIRLENMRKNLTPSKKKYNPRGGGNRAQGSRSGVKRKLDDPTENPLNETTLREKISWMQHKLPTGSNKAAISACLKLTYPNRHAFINEKSPSVSEICEMYPRLKDYLGQMIDAEFARMHQEESEKFLEKFPSYFAPCIILYTESNRPDLITKLDDVAFIDDECLKALIYLVELLPPVNFSSKSAKKATENQGKAQKGTRTAVKTFPNENLLEILPAGANIEEVVREKKQKSSGPVQPFLLYDQRGAGSFLICADSEIIQVGTLSAVAFDLLFKVHYVFNVSYANSLTYFYHFMDFCVYKLSNRNLPSVTNLSVNLRNVSVQK